MSVRKTPGARSKLEAELQELRDRVRALESPQARTRGLVQFGSQLQVGDTIIEQVTLTSGQRFANRPILRWRNTKTGLSAKVPPDQFYGYGIQQANTASIPAGTQAAPGFVLPNTQVVLPPSSPAPRVFRADWSAWLSATVTGWSICAVGLYYSTPTATNLAAWGPVAVLQDNGAANQGATVSMTGLFVLPANQAGPVTLALGTYKTAAGGTIILAGAHSVLVVQEVA